VVHRIPHDVSVPVCLLCGLLPVIIYLWGHVCRSAWSAKLHAQRMAVLDHYQRLAHFRHVERIMRGRGAPAIYTPLIGATLAALDDAIDLRNSMAYPTPNDTLAYATEGELEREMKRRQRAKRRAILWTSLRGKLTHVHPRRWSRSRSRLEGRSPKP